MDVAYVSMITM